MSTQRAATSLARAPGLSSAQAAVLLAEHGPNTIATAPGIPWWRRLSLQLRDPLVVVLLVAAALTIATGDHPDAVIIGLVIAANTAVGLAQEVKADHAIAALRAITAAAATVVRDGRAVAVEASSIVPGDRIILAEGDVVPADAHLDDAVALLVDEASLTGESVPAEKATGAGRDAEVSAGTLVVHGRGAGIVTRTGANSATGRIAAGLSAAPTLTPLQRRLAGLGRTLALVAGGLCVVVMTIGLVRGEPTELMVVTAISLVVAAVPESLPAVVTLGLALGARRMAARHAIVRRLPAVETLGSVTVIATDKTGTLTEGSMVVEGIWTPAAEVPEAAVADVLVPAILCNDAAVQPPQEPGGRWVGVGDPTEAALVTAAAQLPLPVEALRAEHPRVLELPFDSDRKRMTTVHRSADHAGYLVICKGAPEAVLVPSVVDDPVDVLTSARARADAYAADGHRVLAVATAWVDVLPTAAAAEHHLRVAGAVALADPPRAAAAATVAACQAAGITPVLVTGDHLATARNIAARVGISDGNVFARTDPEQKLRLVEGWQRSGHVVAMTGDGVNDGPALRRADIGVAMGRRGTEIARQAADIVLTDDDLGTVVAAVEEGRRVYANVRRFLLYALAGGAAEILVMLVGPAVGLALPLLPAQILWINLLTHGLPGVAMGAEPADTDLMRRPPRPPTESVIGDGLWPRVLVIATAVTAVSLGAALWAHAAGRPWQTVLFLALGTAQFGVALGVRAQPLSRRNPSLLVAVAGAFLLQLAAIHVPVLRDLLKTETLGPAETALGCAMAVVGYAAARAVRRVEQRRAH